MIKVSNLVKKYNSLTAIDNVSFEVYEGEVFGLLGPNGAGKTTLLMMLSTLLKPTSGTATINNFDIVRQPAKVRESIGMVFQDPSSDEILTAYENLKLHSLLYNVELKSIDKKIDEVLTLVGLQNRKYELVKKFSGGMRRRMEIARGLIHHPKVFFLDEPTIGLDPQTRQSIWEYIISLAKNTGMTIVLTTHYMEEAENLCDRVAIIDEGKIAILDTPSNLKKLIGGEIVILEGKNLNSEELKKLPFVLKVEEKDKKVKLTLKDAGKHLTQLLSTAKNVDFVEFHQPNLNDVFLHFTGKNIRDEENDPMDKIRTLFRTTKK